MLNDFIDLFYPRVCMACENGLLKHEQTICNHCEYKLPKTNYHLWDDNPLAKLFWGRLPVYGVASYYFYQKGGAIQNLLHNLKYYDGKTIGNTIGNWFGKELSAAEAYQNIDVIVPVPLHPKKQRMRGFNQSEVFGEGLSQAMNIPLEPHALKRTIFTQSQTKKDKNERWNNVANVFEVQKLHTINHKSILLIDDVMTTGATLEASARSILAQSPDSKIYFATIACGR